MIGIVADDLTGSTDVGVMFTKRGCVVKAFFADVEFKDYTTNTDVLVIDTESRAEPSDTAYCKVRESVRKLLPLSTGMIFKKIDSCFRGNVGAEIDGLLGEIDSNFTIVVPAFPANGRTTKDGYHYLWGKLIEESEMARDPTNPMTDSFLPRVLARQTKRRVGLLDWRVIRRGVAAVSERISGLRRTCEIVVADAAVQEDLSTIASASYNLLLEIDGGRFALCGSSGLAEQFANLVLSGSKMQPYCYPLRDAISEASAINRSSPTLIIAGSIAQATLKQNRKARRHGFAVIEIDPIGAIESRKAYETEINRVAQDALAEISRRPVVICSGKDAKIVTVALELGKSKGLSLTQVVQTICELLAEIAERVVDGASIQKLIVTGGATASAVCRRLGIIGLMLLEEVKLGVPRCLTIGRDNMLVVLKPGAYGDDNFYADVIKNDFT